MDLLQGVETKTVQENETLFENVKEFIIKLDGLRDEAMKYHNISWH